MTRANGKGAKNIKLEARNPKQIQIFNSQKILNGPVSDLRFGFARLSLFWISIFGFRMLSSWRVSASNFVEVVLLNI